MGFAPRPDRAEPLIISRTIKETRRPPIPMLTESQGALNHTSEETAEDAEERGDTPCIVVFVGPLTILVCDT